MNLKIHVAIKCFIIALPLLGISVYAQAGDKPTAREIEVCLQTIRELTDGDPPKSAIALCQQGKIDAAIDKAMSGR